jgi:riboflavin biosynthesis pyrimidine reductase
MVYENLIFPPAAGRPYVFSNFIQTLDGKVQVLHRKREYWPLGSRTDFRTLQEIRAHADALVHGKNTVRGSQVLRVLAAEGVPELRRSLGRSGDFWYVIVSGHPGEELLPHVAPCPEGVRVLLATTDEARLPAALPAEVEVARCGAGLVDPARVLAELDARGCERVCVEGGPTLMGPWYAADLVDELFLTLAPRVIGGGAGETLTMVEGGLLPPEAVRRFELLSVRAVEGEVFLRYHRPRDV